MMDPHQPIRFPQYRPPQWFLEQALAAPEGREEHSYAARCGRAKAYLERIILEIRRGRLKFQEEGE